MDKTRGSKARFKSCNVETTQGSVINPHGLYVDDKQESSQSRLRCEHTLTIYSSSYQIWPEVKVYRMGLSGVQVSVLSYLNFHRPPASGSYE